MSVNFRVVRTLPRPHDQDEEPRFSFIVKSRYILKACKSVLQEWPGISWNSAPLEVCVRFFSFVRLTHSSSQLDADILVTSLPGFTTYRNELAVKRNKSEEESHILASVDFLLELLHTDYRTTITTINNLIPYGESNWEVLYTILIPGSTFLTKCAVTGEPRALKLISYRQRWDNQGFPYYLLIFQSIDLIDRPVTQTVGVGWVETSVVLRHFKGTINITSLDAFPIQYHPDQQISLNVERNGSR